MVGDECDDRCDGMKMTRCVTHKIFGHFRACMGSGDDLIYRRLECAIIEAVRFVRDHFMFDPSLVKMHDLPRISIGQPYRIGDLL